jgi:hypothetical protein
MHLRFPRAPSGAAQECRAVRKKLKSTTQDGDPRPKYKVVLLSEPARDPLDICFDHDPHDPEADFHYPHALDLARSLLDGRFQFTSPSHFGYLEGDAHEDAARLALAYLLRSDRPLDWRLRYSLASLFDPRPRPCEFGISLPNRQRFAFQIPANPRKLEIVRRFGKKRLSDFVRNEFIAWVMHIYLDGDGKNGKAATEDAAAKLTQRHFALDKGQVLKVWAEHKKECDLCKWQRRGGNIDDEASTLRRTLDWFAAE